MVRYALNKSMEEREMRLLLPTALVCLLTGLAHICGAEMIINENFDSWTKSPGPGWQARVEPGGELSLIADGSGGKSLRLSKPRLACSYVSHSLGADRKELYIGIRVRAESLDFGKSYEQSAGGVWILTLYGRGDGGEKIRMALQLGSARDVLVNPMTKSLANQRPGLTWAPGETLDVGVGLKYGQQGFVKFYYGGAKIYEVHYNTIDPGPTSVDSIRIGPQYQAATTLVVDDIKIATTEDEAGVLAKVSQSPTPLRIKIDSSGILKPTHLDCFGTTVGLSEPVPYKNLKSAMLPLGITSARWMNGVCRENWNEYERYPGRPWPFYYKENDASSPWGKDGRSFEEHLEYFGNNIQVACVQDINITSDPAKLLDGPNGWIQYNKRRGHRDCIYEIGNEMDGTQWPQSGYMFTGSKWEQICDGHIRWMPAGPERVPQSLMHAEAGYNYSLPFNSPGAALYVGCRRRWDMCRVDLSKPGQGNAKLTWEIRTDKGWETVYSEGSGGYLIPKYARLDDLHDARNFTRSSVVCWSDSFFKTGGPYDRWKPASPKEISGGACPGDEKLYYIRISREGGSYTGGEPCEASLGFATTPSEYVSAVKSISAVIARNGGEAYASSSYIDGHPGWSEALESMAPYVKGFAFHGYESRETTWDALAKGEQEYYPFQSMLYDVERMRKVAEEAHSLKPLAGKKLALTEWAIPDAEYPGGLATAIALCEIQKGGWNAAHRNSWGTQSVIPGDGSWGLLRPTSSTVNAEWIERPSATAFKMIRHATKEKLVEARATLIQSGKEREYPGVYVCAFQGTQAKDKSLVLVNRTDATLTDVPIEWKGAAGTKFRVITLQSAAGIRGNNEGPISQVTMESRPSITFSATGQTRFTLPPYSLYVIEVMPG
jgi:hypothetical protein